MPRKYALKHPIKIGESSTLDSLTLRDHVIAADYLAFDQRGGVAQRMALIASVCGTDEAVVRKLHGADYVALERQVDALMQAAEVEALADEPKTGADGQPLSEAQKKVMRLVQAVMLVTNTMHQPLPLVRAMPVPELMFWARASLAMRR